MTCLFSVRNDVGLRLAYRTSLSIHTLNLGPTRGIRPSKAARLINPRQTNVMKMPVELNIYTVNVHRMGGGGARGSVVGRGIMLHARRSRVRVPVRSFQPYYGPGVD
jgi:hypothetical protein